MEKIEIKVTKTSTTIINAYILNQGEYQVDKCQFDFSSEYEGLVKKAVFVSNENEIDMVILNDECDIPYEILQNSTEFTLKVYGYQVENNELKERYSPTPRKIFLREGSYQGSKEVITPTQFEQYEQALHDGLEEVANVNIDVSKVGKVATIEIINRNGETKSASVTDGADFQYNWDGTKLGVKTDEEEEYQYVDLKGDKGDQGIQGIQGPQGEQGIQGIQGPQGIQGEAFTIKKTYSSVAEMNADFNNMQLGDYVMIASTVEVEDNAKLYTRGESQWIFISDFSGATGIQGPQGPQGIQGIQGIQGLQGEKGDTGATGNGIASIQKTSTSGLVDTYTITYTNGTTTTFEVTNGEDGEITETELNVVRTDVDDLRRNQLMNTETGTNIDVDDAFDTRIMEDVMTKESTQTGTPTPEIPVEVKTVKGYRNLLDNQAQNDTINGIKITVNADKSITLNGTSTSATNIYLLQNGASTLKAGTYTMYCKGRILGKIGIYFNSDASTRISQIGATDSDDVISKQFTINEDTTLYSAWIYVPNNITLSNVTIYPMLTKSDNELPYVPYGTNWIYTKVTNGTDTNYYTIPLNNNEVVGIGDYKDELIVDRNGHCWLNKKIGKVILNGSEDGWVYDSSQNFYIQNNNIKRLNDYSNLMLSNNYIANSTHQNMPNYTISGYYSPSAYLEQNWLYIKNNDFSNITNFKNWLSTHNTEVYYVSVEEQLIDLNYTADIRLFNGVNNISNGDDMDMEIKYVQDINMIINNLINGQSL